MRILILTPGFPESDKDTTCIPALQALVGDLHARYRHELDLQVVTFHYPFNTGAYQWNGIPCWSAGGTNHKLPQKLFTWMKVLNFICRNHKEQQVDIIHSFWLQECTFIAQLASGMTGARHIAHAMGQDVLPINRYIKFLHRKKMELIAISPFTKRSLVEHFQWTPSAVIPFGIDISDFANISNGQKRKVDVLAVGSLIPVKNHDLFIDIFAVLKDNFPELKGTIIGHGPLMQSLKLKIEKKGLSSGLTLTGLMPRPEVLKIMAESKILLHTSLFESAGYVMLEALYSGMKVVSLKTGFVPDSPEAIQCGNREEMVDAMKKLLSTEMNFKRVAVPLIAETSEAVFNIYTK